MKGRVDEFSLERKFQSDVTAYFSMAERKRRITEYAVLLLRLAKLEYTYRELSQMLDMQLTVLSRYVKGWVEPSLERSEVIIKRLQPSCGLSAWLSKAVELKQGYFNNTSMISSPIVLELASYDCILRFAGHRVNSVLTCAVDGVPLATLIATKINANLAVAKPYKETGVESFMEVEELTEDGGRKSWYLPAGIIRRGDGVLIVDDVVRYGRMLKIMFEFVKMAKAYVAGVYALVTIGDRYKKVVPEDVRYETALKVDL